jgi:DNA-directed RNA polymerase subunit RPC12/RpoP
MWDASLRDRRFRVPEPTVTPECRLCWKVFDLQHPLIEATDQYVYARCPYCGSSFPIRHGDYEAFLERGKLRAL